MFGYFWKANRKHLQASFMHAYICVCVCVGVRVHSRVHVKAHLNDHVLVHLYDHALVHLYDHTIHQQTYMTMHWWTYMTIHQHTYMTMHWYTYMTMHLKNRRKFQVSFLRNFHLAFVTESFTGLKFAWAGEARWLPGPRDPSTCVYLPKVRTASVHCRIWLFIWLRGVRLRSSYWHGKQFSSQTFYMLTLFNPITSLLGTNA